MRSHLERSATALRKICTEDLATISRVTGRLISLSPDGSEDDLWLVWQLLTPPSPTLLPPRLAVPSGSDLFASYKAEGPRMTRMTRIQNVA